jgi:methionyl-tRNA synthetase
VVPAGERTSLDERIPDTLVRYRSAMDGNLLHQGASAAMELAGAANGFIEERAPWSQSKSPAQADALDATLGALARALAALSAMLEPFMPVKMERLATSLGLDGVPFLDDVADLDAAGRTVERGDVLFPRPDTK